MRTFRLAAGLALGAAAVHAFPALAAVAGPLRAPLGVRSTTDHAGVALTFDDGPHPQGTPAVLEALRAADARATFFLVGEQVERYPTLAQDIVAAGHQVGLHGYRHRLLLRLTPAQTRDDLERGFAVVSETTGVVPRLWRPPKGVLSAASLFFAHRRGWEPVLWSRHGRDWAGRATSESIAARLEPGLVPGAILLMHDADHYAAARSWERTAGSLAPLFAALERRGLPAVAI